MTGVFSVLLLPHLQGGNRSEVPEYWDDKSHKNLEECKELNMCLCLIYSIANLVWWSGASIFQRPGCWLHPPLLGCLVWHIGLGPTYFMLNFIAHAYTAHEAVITPSCLLVCSLQFSTKYRLVLCNIRLYGVVIRWCLLVSIAGMGH